MDSLREKAKMLAAFEELWASSRCLLPIKGPSSAPPLPLVTPRLLPHLRFLFAVSVASAATSSTTLVCLPTWLILCPSHASGSIPVTRLDSSLIWFLDLFPVPSAFWFPSAG